MSEFKGTKGEWIFEYNHKPKRTRIEVNAYPYKDRPDFKENMYSYMLSEDECDQSCCCIEERANAQLIACAPEMLEALKEAIKMLYSSTEFEVLQNWRKKTDDFEQLIKKATSCQ